LETVITTPNKVAVAFFVAIVSAGAQPPIEDASANSVFLGCKAFAEAQVTNLQLNQWSAPQTVDRLQIGN
jgi:hypothetical protein